MSDTLSEIFQQAKKYSLDKGQVLVSPDEKPRGVHFIRSGYIIKAYEISTEGEYKVVSISGPGEIFPLHWSLDEKYLQLFYETMCPTVINILPKPAFKSLFGNNIRLLREVLTLVLRAFRYSQERIQNLELDTAREQVAFRLLFLGVHFGHKQDKQLDVDVPITYQDIAESLTLSPNSSIR